MSHDLEKLRAACRDSCAEYGDPPCYELDNDPTREGRDFCLACHLAAGVPFEETPEPLDPDAVVRPLL